MHDDDILLEKEAEKIEEILKLKTETLASLCDIIRNESENSNYDLENKLHNYEVKTTKFSDEMEIINQTNSNDNLKKIVEMFNIQLILTEDTIVACRKYIKIIFVKK